MLPVPTAFLPTQMLPEPLEPWRGREELVPSLCALKFSTNHCVPLHFSPVCSARSSLFRVFCVYFGSVLVVSHLASPGINAFSLPGYWGVMDARNGVAVGVSGSFLIPRSSES